MTGRPHLLNGNEEGIRITVCFDGLDMLVVATGGPLVPKFIAGPAPVMHGLCFQGQLIRLLVHIGQHEDLSCYMVGYDDGEQPSLLVKIQFDGCHRRTSIPASCMACLVSAMETSPKWKMEAARAPVAGVS